MKDDFWLQKWETNNIGFHEGKGNALMQKHFSRLGVSRGGRIFLPLCGKTRDISWLLAQGYCVVGAELSKLAIEQLFDELGLKPNITPYGPLLQFSAEQIDIFVGNIFELSKELLGKVDAIYDRAAMAALPPTVRPKYTAHLLEISNRARQLLICFEYDQALMDGPPFSIDGEEVKSHYREAYEVTLVESKRLPFSLKGKAAAVEAVWLLRKFG